MVGSFSFSCFTLLRSSLRWITSSLIYGSCLWAFLLPSSFFDVSLKAAFTVCYLHLLKYWDEIALKLPILITFFFSFRRTRFHDNMAKIDIILLLIILQLLQPATTSDQNNKLETKNGLRSYLDDGTADDLESPHGRQRKRLFRLTNGTSIEFAIYRRQGDLPQASNPEASIENTTAATPPILTAEEPVYPAGENDPIDHFAPDPVINDGFLDNSTDIIADDPGDDEILVDIFEDVVNNFLESDDGNDTT